MTSPCHLPREAGALPLRSTELLCRGAIWLCAELIERLRNLLNGINVVASRSVCGQQSLSIPVLPHAILRRLRPARPAPRMLTKTMASYTSIDALHCRRRMTRGRHSSRSGHGIDRSDRIFQRNAPKIYVGSHQWSRVFAESSQRSVEVMSIFPGSRPKRHDQICNSPTGTLAISTDQSGRYVQGVRLRL